MVNIFIIEDQISYREPISFLINNSDGYQCAGVFEDFESSQNKIAEEKPDVVLLDINLPGLSGIESVGVIKTLSPETEVIMLTASSDRGSVFKSIRNGASGYILKSDDPANIIKAIGESLNGGAPMSMSIARMITESLRKPSSDLNLTSQQQNILKKLYEGKSYQAIANEMYIEKTTVKYHIKNIYKALHVNNKTLAVLKAKEEGII